MTTVTVLRIICIALCCIFSAHADSLEERLNTLERIVEKQTAMIDLFKNENSELKFRVEKLEIEVVRLSGVQERDDEMGAMNGNFGNNYKNTNNRTATTFDKVGIQDGLKSSMTNKSTKLNRLAKRQAESIAFHVYLTGNSCFNDQQVLLFDGEEVDIGSAYNEHDGIYVVPETGIYVFSWSYLSNYHEWAQTEIVVNGVSKGSTISDDPTNVGFWSPATALVVVSVNAGDHVFIRRVGGRGCTAIGKNGYARTTFSGWKL
ncbi:uncharacterized protein LOC123528304 [Mercenaria mercenaria]|uniref:uncharacterized protein LOC123528304 n=1 Tax=Mercenaria mercenaria TaxID=6596 RepID=UPI00234E9526|nr:uncharacterized protein LOC123528304 [Mercenaria mercenaria]